MSGATANVELAERKEALESPRIERTARQFADVLAGLCKHSKSTQCAAVNVSIGSQSEIQCKHQLPACGSSARAASGGGGVRNLVDPASSHMLVSKIKPCMSQYKLLYGETANGSLKQL